MIAVEPPTQCLHMIQKLMSRNQGWHPHFLLRKKFHWQLKKPLLNPVHNGTSQSRHAYTTPPIKTELVMMLKPFQMNVIEIPTRSRSSNMINSFQMVPTPPVTDKAFPDVEPIPDASNRLPLHDNSPTMEAAPPLFANNAPAVIAAVPSTHCWEWLWRSAGDEGVDGGWSCAAADAMQRRKMWLCCRVSYRWRWLR